MVPANLGGYMRFRFLRVVLFLKNSWNMWNKYRQNGLCLRNNIWVKMEHMVLFIKEKKGFGEFSQQHTGNHRSCLVGTGVRKCWCETIRTGIAEPPCWYLNVVGPFWSFLTLYPYVQAQTVSLESEKWFFDWVKSKGSRQWTSAGFQPRV